MKSWRTTAFGVLAFLSLFASAGVAVLDDDPNTNPNWAKIFEYLGIGSVAAGVMSSRDHKVSDEQAGAGRN